MTFIDTGGVWALAIAPQAEADESGLYSAQQPNTPLALEAARKKAGRALQVGPEAVAKTESATPQGLAEGASLGTRMGVVSDNHGYLDPAVLEIFAGVDHIIHAGDVMDPVILDRLATIAPVTAVVGNMDSGEPTSVLPREVVGEVAGVRFLVGHKRKRLLRDLAAGSIAGLGAGEMPDLVLYGHDHVPAAAWVDGTLYLDPGSASAPHEEDDGPTAAIVEVTRAGLAVTFVPVPRRARAAATGGQPWAPAARLATPRCSPRAACQARLHALEHELHLGQAPESSSSSKVFVSSRGHAPELGERVGEHYPGRRPGAARPPGGRSRRSHRRPLRAPHSLQTAMASLPWCAPPKSASACDAASSG